MARFRTGKRRQARAKVVFPVHLWAVGANGDQESHLLHPLDVSDHCVKLGGVQGGFNIGEMIGIQYRHQLAKFREWY